MAAFEFKISAALCINLALSTSAEAEIIFAFESLYVLEVIDKSACNSGVIVISLIKICSTKTPHFFTLLST